jgi:hypothetical protein
MGEFEIGYQSEPSRLVLILPTGLQDDERLLALTICARLRRH